MNEQKITPKKSEAGLKKTEAFRTEYMRPTKTEKGRTAVLRALFRT